MHAFVTATIAATRRLRRAPTFTCFALATLAVGIGITTAFSAVIGTITTPGLGVHDTSTLVTVAAFSPLGSLGPATISGPDAADLKARSRTFADGALHTAFSAALVGGGSSQPADVVAVSGNYFNILTVNTALGRPIQPADDAPAATPVVVLSYTSWRSQFSGDPAVIGTTVTLAGQLAQVVGVMPKNFHGVGARFGRPSAWVAMSLASRFEGRWATLADTNRRSNRRFELIARMGPATPSASVSAEVAGIGRTLDLTVPGATKRIWQVFSFDELSRKEASQGPLLMLFALPVAVLLAACTNLANLMASRSAVCGATSSPCERHWGLPGDALSLRSSQNPLFLLWAVPC